MKSLFVYIFGKTFYLYERIYADKDHPQYFSSSMIALLIILSASVLISLVLYQINPSLVTDFYDYYKYASVAILLLIWRFFHPERRYKWIIKDYKELSKSNKAQLGIITIVYVLVLLFVFFKIGDLVRAYNLGE